MPASIAPQTPNLSSNCAQSALLEGLQPALRSTLSNLNINLDYELARYRYAKRGETPPGTTAPNFQPRRRSLNLINVPPATQPSPPNPVTRAAGTPPPPPPNPRLQQVASPPGMAKSPSEVAALRSAIVQQAARSPRNLPGVISRPLAKFRCAPIIAAPRTVAGASLPPLDRKRDDAPGIGCPDAIAGSQCRVWLRVGQSVSRESSLSEHATSPILPQ